MKRYLMRGGNSPLELMDLEATFRGNMIGNNSGNTLYLYGVYRTLRTEDVRIDVDRYGVERSYTDKDIDRINQEYDAYICPLADAIRLDFRKKLESYAAFFEKLTIPVYVIGMGIRADAKEPQLRNLPQDPEVKRFVKAVLNHSSKLGLRGEMTGEYLSSLGFKEGRDFEAIGCPSMYMNGRELNMRPVPDFSDASKLRLAVNMSAKTPQVLMEFLDRQMKRYPDHYLIEQNMEEVRLLYFGRPMKDHACEAFPTNIRHPLLQEDRYRTFLNVKTWRDLMRERDFSIGSKLHGNVAAIVSGCPAIMFPIDVRMQELVRFHKFPCFEIGRLTENTTLEDVLAAVDLESYQKVHAANFDHFVDFLDDLGIDHIFQNDRSRKTAPCDPIVESLEYPEISNVLSVSGEELRSRMFLALELDRMDLVKRQKELSNVKKNLNVLKSRMSDGDQELDELHHELDRLKEENASLKKHDIRKIPTADLMKIVRERGVKRLKKGFDK